MDFKDDYGSVNYLQSFGRKVGVIFALFAGMIAFIMNNSLASWSMLLILVYAIYNIVKCIRQEQLDAAEFMLNLILCGALNSIGTLFVGILFHLLLLRMVMRVGQLRALRCATLIGAMFMLTSLVGAKAITVQLWTEIAFNILSMGILTIIAIHLHYIFGGQRDVDELLRQNNHNFQMAFTDALTGLYNYRAYQEKMAQLTTGYVLLIIDIDRFKNINDTYGHEFGNNVLVHLANIVKNSIRHTDMAFRYGGEEFVIVLPDATEELGMRIAERLRVQVAERKFYFDASRITVTISIGVANNQNGFTAQTVFEQADKALYTAKESGRNNVKRFVS